MWNPYTIQTTQLLLMVVVFALFSDCHYILLFLALLVCFCLMILSLNKAHFYCLCLCESGMIAICFASSHVLWISYNCLHVISCQDWGLQSQSWAQSADYDQMEHGECSRCVSWKFCILHWHVLEHSVSIACFRTLYADRAESGTDPDMLLWRNVSIACWNPGCEMSSY